MSKVPSYSISHIPPSRPRSNIWSFTAFRRIVVISLASAKPDTRSITLRLCNSAIT